MSSNGNNQGAKQAPDGKCLECGADLTISDIVGTIGIAIIAKHCGKLWYTEISKSDTEFLSTIANTLNAIKEEAE